MYISWYASTERIKLQTFRCIIFELFKYNAAKCMKIYWSISFENNSVAIYFIHNPFEVRVCSS